MWEKRGAFTSHAGVLLSPMSRYHNTDVSSFLKSMHMKMTQIPYLDIRSMLLSRQRSIQVNCFAMGYSRKNKQTGGFQDILFLKKSLDFFCFSLYPWKFRIKQSSIPGNLVKLCMLHPSEILRSKNQDPWKFHMNLSWSPLEILLCF